MIVTNLYVKRLDGKAACEGHDVARLVSLADKAMCGGLTWYTQDWEVNGASEDFDSRFLTGCVRIGHASAAIDAARTVVQFEWGRLLGFSQEPDDGFCDELEDVECVELSMVAPLVCAIQMLDAAALSVVTHHADIIRALEHANCVALKRTYRI